MTRVAVLSADLIADSSSFETSLGRANSAMNNSKGIWNSALSEAGRNFDLTTSRVLKFGAALGASFGATKLISDLKSVTTEMDQIGKASDALGVSTESLSAMAYAGKLAGVSMDDLVIEIKKMEKAVIEAQDGNKKFIADFKELGLNVNTLRGMKVEDTFALIAARIAALQDPYLRATIAQDLFSKGGIKVINMAAQQKDGLQGVYNEAQKLGQVFDREAAAKAEEFNDSLTRLNESYRGLMVSFASSGGLDTLSNGINALARNMGTLALAAEGVAAIMGARLLGSAVVLTSAWVATTAQAGSFFIALGSLAFGSEAAAVGMLALNGATTLLGSTIAFLGGPLGVAVLGTLVLMSKYTNAAAEAQKSLNSQMAAMNSESAEYITASNSRRKAIEDDTIANIQNYKKELVALQALANTLDNENPVFRLSRNLGSKLGIDTSAGDVKAYAANVQKAIDALDASLATFQKVKNGAFGVGGGTGQKQAEDFERIVASLREQSDQIQLQNDMYGKEEYAIKRASEAIKIKNELTKDGVKISIQQQGIIDKYLDKIEKEEQINEKIARQKQEEAQATDDLTNAIGSEFDTALQKGEKFSDFLAHLGTDLESFLLKLEIEDPIKNALSDAFKGIQSSSAGTGSGGLLSSIFSSLPSFDVGTNYVPHDMVANIHKGEEIVPAWAAGQSRGGGDIIVNVGVVNNAGAQVSTSQQKTSQGVDLNVMIDEATASNITKKGSKTSRALSALSQASLIKRG